MTEADERAYHEACAVYYNQLVDLAEQMGLTGETKHAFIFEQMSVFRKEWLRNFLQTRTY